MPDPILDVAPADAGERSIAQGDWVRIKTKVGSVVARANIVAGLASGSVFGQHGWWVERVDGTAYDTAQPMAGNLNAAVSTELCDPISGSIPLRCTWCEIEKSPTDVAHARARLFEVELPRYAVAIADPGEAFAEAVVADRHQHVPAVA